MAIAVHVVTKLPRSAKADVLILPHGQKLPVGIQAALKERDFKGEWGTADLIVAPRGSAALFLGVIGLGEESDSFRRAEGLRRALARIIKDARQHALKTVALDLTLESDQKSLARAAVEAAGMATYAFSEHKKSLAREERARAVRNFMIIVDRKQREAVQRAVRETQQMMAGVKLTRDLVNQPASHMKPRTLVEVAKNLADGKTITVQTMNRLQAEKDGWRAFLAVAAGSAEEPYVIHLTYRVKSRQGGTTRLRPKKIVLVGKGVTFDSGGLSLKPAQYMEDMKIDMAGAATVLGVFSVLPKLKLSVEVHGVIAACENMPSGTAYRPGDVIVARSGKTIEILNTDAEGRVTLADALDYAQQMKPDAVVDLATLTGACMVALGETYAGLFSNNPELNGALMTAAKQAGEGLEDLPLPEEYKQHIESKVADVSNVPSQYAGAVTAALFLQEFAGKAAWAHIDLAGPSYLAKPILPYWTGGGTGYGVRTLIEWLKHGIVKE